MTTPGLWGLEAERPDRVLQQTREPLTWRLYLFGTVKGWELIRVGFREGTERTQERGRLGRYGAKDSEDGL